MRTSSNPLRWLGALSLVAITAMLVACGGGGDDSSSAGGSGQSTVGSNGSSSGSGSGSGSTSSGSGDTGSNGQVPIVVNAGVQNVINMPSVSVKVCAPGTATCQTIDNVLLDTASYGLRLVGTAASGVLGNLPAQTASNGGALAECGQFVSSFTWGSVRQADVTIGGLTASALPVQIIGDLATSSVPTSCSNGGTSANTVEALGANGILGVGQAPFDCGISCVSSTTFSNYYSCPSGGTCAATTVALNAQVANPVARLPSNNNGVSVQLNAPSGGTATGVLTLGVPSALPSGVTRLTTTTAGDLTGTFQGRAISTAFFDTGSNAYFFDSTGGASLPTCSRNTSFYCPTTNVNLTATLTDGSNNLSLAFTIANAQTLFNTGAFAIANLGGPFGQSSTLDFGLPHFFGRTVYFGIDQRSIGGTQTPFVAL
ncbi:DUF3443 domain-containing protein [Burkholderia plantarii]|uniref:DUF3443 domain-containing protein n=1 Tax=Burkholderia plantarii TaxID=41899 RepID=UPI0006D8B892|nr:DUF3443 domain-containing protein [Burkholderia plantarii]ALK29000.1 Gly/Ala/Ser-rich lipoprotein [Burkholderia plantarii]GLZ17556.1 Gly/Ala/Ser-rich lipoprotein [Burkholderia plantarii]